MTPFFMVVSTMAAGYGAFIEWRIAIRRTSPNVRPPAEHAGFRGRSRSEIDVDRRKLYTCVVRKYASSDKNPGNWHIGKSLRQHLLHGSKMHCRRQHVINDPIGQASERLCQQRFIGLDRPMTYNDTRD